jgi:hypothetical protein
VADIFLFTWSYPVVFLGLIFHFLLYHIQWYCCGWYFPFYFIISSGISVADILLFTLSYPVVFLWLIFHFLLYHIQWYFYSLFHLLFSSLRHRLPWPILSSCFDPFVFLFLATFKSFGFQNIFSFRENDVDYSYRNESGVLWEKMMKVILTETSQGFFERKWCRLFLQKRVRGTQLDISTLYYFYLFMLSYLSIFLLLIFYYIFIYIYINV